MLKEAIEEFRKENSHSNASLILKEVKPFAVNYYTEKYGEKSQMPVLMHLFTVCYKSSLIECDGTDEFIKLMNEFSKKYEDSASCADAFIEKMKTCIDELYKKLVLVRK